MAADFLEQLVAERHEYNGDFVRRNVLVGKRAKGEGGVAQCCKRPLRS
jgi:hypothetical protein